MRATSDRDLAPPPNSPAAPMPPAARPDRRARFWDRTAERYARTPIADEAAYQTKLAVTREYLRPDMEVLEIGCGTGSTALLHAPYVRHILAVDVSSRMIGIAQAKLGPAAISNVTFRQGAIEDLEAKPQSFDAVLAMSLLHLLADPMAAIVKVRELLKPGGVLVSSTACIADMALTIRLAIPAARLAGLAPYVNVFTERKLVANLEAAGFEIAHRWKPRKGQPVFIVARKPE